MARNTFFSFHYERDAWRAGQVRNCDLLATEDEHGFIDAVEWESIEREGAAAIEKWIDGQLEGTTVTVVLIGAETAEREWVLEEIRKSWNRGNGVIGVRIHQLKNHERETDKAGKNPFELFELPGGKLLSSVCKVYDWVDDGGRNSLGGWSEEAIALRDEHDLSDEIVLACEAKKSARVEPPRAPAVLRGVNAAEAFKPRAPWCGDVRK